MKYIMAVYDDTDAQLDALVEDDHHEEIFSIDDIMASPEMRLLLERIPEQFDDGQSVIESFGYIRELIRVFGCPTISYHSLVFCNYMTAQACEQTFVLPVDNERVLAYTW
jgi:hypothetical protein